MLARDDVEILMITTKHKNDEIKFLQEDETV